MVQINWTFQAQNDLLGIADYISKDSKRYAKLQVDRIKNRTKILKPQTRSGKIVSEIYRENVNTVL